MFDDTSRGSRCFNDEVLTLNADICNDVEKDGLPSLLECLFMFPCFHISFDKCLEVSYGWSDLY